VETRQANTFGRGYVAATSYDNLDESWGDALADVPEEVPHIVYEANRSRYDARRKIKWRW
jgi:hypothetical protein